MDIPPPPLFIECLGNRAASVPQMHRSRSTNRKSEDCVEFYFCRISCALPWPRAVELAGEGGFGRTGGRRSEGGPRPLKSKQGCRPLHASERTAFCAVAAMDSVRPSVRPTIAHRPNGRPTPFGFLPFDCLSVQSPRQYFAFDAVGRTEQSQRVEWSGSSQLGNT